MSDEVKTVDLDKFESLARKRKNVTAEISELRGEYGSDVKDFCDKQSLNKQAFGTAAKLMGMDNLKARDFLRSFDALRPRIDQYLDQQNEFDLKDEAESDGDDPDDDALDSEDVDAGDAEVTEDDDFLDKEEAA